MNIASEKADIVKRLEMVNDASLIQAIKSLLDFAFSKQSEGIALEESIEKGLKESMNQNVRPHSEVMEEFRRQYGK